MNKIGNYVAFNKYILRTPCLPSQTSEGIDVDTIRELCAIPIISESIYLASPELHWEMSKYLKRDHKNEDEKLIYALLKYLLRMSTRCTPFGLFSGCSVGKITTETNITLKNPNKHKRVTRLDMNYLCSLSKKLESDTRIREELVYYPNTSLYKIGNEIRYVEYRYINTERRHFLISIEANFYIDKILKNASNGSSINHLAELIIEPDITISDAITFINELIDNQILISSISPSVTGKNYLEILNEKMESKTLKNWFNDIQYKLRQLNNDEINTNFTLYNEINEIANNFEVPINKKFLFQTDLVVTTTKNELNKKIIDDVIEGLKILNKLTFKRENKKLSNFKNKFYKRFEEEEIPLSLALDVETGIGYSEEHEDGDSYSVSSLIDDLIINPVIEEEEILKSDYTKADTLMHRKLLESIQNTSKSIKLQDDDFEDFEENWSDIANTFSVMIKVVDTNESKPLMLLSDSVGATAAMLLGRFGHTDQAISDYIDEIIEKEEKENTIYAEILHLPESRAGNILARTNLREYEIPYLAKSTLPYDRQLDINDLYISIRNDHIFLRSKKTNKEVIPILSNAHNHDMNPLPIYSFLGDLQTQGLRGELLFEWGDFLEDIAYLPRVSYKNIIFSLAKWTVNKKEIAQLNNLKTLHTWRKKRNIPQKILLTDYDNELLIDLENELSCKTFLSLIKRKKKVVLKEYLFNDKKALVNNQENKSFNSEIILSFYKNKLNDSY